MSISQFIIDRALASMEQAIHQGSLTLIEPNGRERQITGVDSGPAATLIINDWRIIGAVSSRGDIGFGEAYMAGWWDSPDLEALVGLLILNMPKLGRFAWGSPLERLKGVVLERVFRRNSEKGSKRNIMAHYDLGNDFYKLWLDPTMSYSSAIYQGKEASLKAAQVAKYHRILDRVGPDRGSVLEIGCGWGGFAEEAVEKNHRVTGITISNEQHGYATKRLGSGADIRLEDYRKTEGKFDAVVSIEMFEAVGERYWPTYFRTVKDRLADDGVAVIQTISISEELFDSYRKSSDFIRHHIFPGGMLPSVERFRDQAAKVKLACRDVFSFGQDYARTLREWLTRFDAVIDDVRALGHGEDFVRGWRLYLAICAAGFANGRIDVHQIELAHATR